MVADRGEVGARGRDQVAGRGPRVALLLQADDRRLQEALSVTLITFAPHPGSLLYNRIDLYGRMYITHDREAHDETATFVRRPGNFDGRPSRARPAAPRRSARSPSTLLLGSAMPVPAMPGGTAEAGRLHSALARIDEAGQPRGAAAGAAPGARPARRRRAAGRAARTGEHHPGPGRRSPSTSCAR